MAIEETRSVGVGNIDSFSKSPGAKQRVPGFLYELVRILILLYELVRVVFCHLITWVELPIGHVNLVECASD